MYFLYSLGVCSYFQQMLNNFANFDFLFTKLSILVKNVLLSQVGMLGNIFLWLVANWKQWPFT